MRGVGQSGPGGQNLHAPDGGVIDVVAKIPLIEQSSEFGPERSGPGFGNPAPNDIEEDGDDDNQKRDGGLLDEEAHILLACVFLKMFLIFQLPISDGIGDEIIELLAHRQSDDADQGPDQGKDNEDQGQDDDESYKNATIGIVKLYGR